MKTPRFITIFFLVSSVVGFLISVFLWSGEDSKTYTDGEAFVQFVQHGFDFHVSVGFLFASSFMLSSAFWFWILCRLR
jgi:hypothetical protein